MYNGNMKSGGESGKTTRSGDENLALYRKYRSQNLDEVLGQSQVTDVLKAATKRDVFAHAYLLVGQRGTGKTSVARILAHLINATDYDAEDFDIIEIDAASHGSVDEARDLREHADLAPLQSRNKVYIIDEVHMLSRQAFDALLKLIEEPPRHLYFIFATTELSKVPATILSRVQRFTFRPVAAEIVAKHLRDIADAEKIDISDEALLLIANKGGGSFRDSITLLDQMKSVGEKISLQLVEDILGIASASVISEIIDCVDAADVSSLVAKLQSLFNDGNTATELAKQLTDELAKLAIDQPRFYVLIEQLLDVAKSSNAQLKLTAVLANFANVNNVKPQIAKELATKLQPEKSPELPAKKVVEAKVESAATPADITEIVPKKRARAINDTPVHTAKINPSEFDWNEVLKNFEELDEPAAFSIAKNADFRVDETTLTLFFAKGFWRKKADTRHFRDILSRAINTTIDANIKIVVASEPVPGDSAAANVLNIIGGEIVEAGA